MIIRITVAHWYIDLMSGSRWLPKVSGSTFGATKRWNWERRKALFRPSSVTLTSSDCSCKCRSCTCLNFFKTADEKLSLVQQSVLLKYLSLKNVASINERRGDVKRSLEYYLQVRECLRRFVTILKALELDDTDVVMWYHCGSLALVLNDLNTAR